MQPSTSESNSSTYDDESDVLMEDSEEICRELTSFDVDQALYTLKKNQISTKCDCCHLLRKTATSRLFLPLARRSRPYLSNRSHPLLCSNCIEIKRQQEIDILKKNQEKSRSNHLYQTILNFDITSDEQFALNNHQYQSKQMLIWKTNNSNLSYDINSLNENEKKCLLEETIKKLQIILNNYSITTTNENNLDFTYHTLQTTINLLSSSQNSI